MRALLLGAAASVAAFAVSAPAAALDPPALQAGAGLHGVTVHRGSAVHFDRGHGGEWKDGDHDRRDRRRFRRTVVIGPWGWSEPRDFDGNRSFDADRWNDWWHERPWRAYPRWVRSNDQCERVWQGGGVWRCEW